MARDRRRGDMPRRDRWLELVVSVGVSIVSSGLAMTWLLSAKLAKFETTLDQQQTALVDLNNRVASNKSSLQGIETVNATQMSQIAVSDARYTDILRRLDSLDLKVDRALDENRSRR